MAQTLSSLSVVASLLGVAGLALILGGCGSAYDSLGNANQVGAAGYQPTVDLAASSKPDPGLYQVALQECRALAANRQATEAQIAQEDTFADAIDGAAAGGVYGALAGEDVVGGANRTEAGLKAGAIVGLASAIIGVGQRTQRVSAAARGTVDACLSNRGYVVYR